MSINTTITPGGGGGGGGGGPTGSNGGGCGGGSCGGPCGACKFLRRKCIAGCIFAPYFDSEQGAAHFAAVHKVFGASNVSKMLHHIPAHKRHDAVATICFEAQSRLRDPVYGCVAHIFALQQQVVTLQAELNCLQAHLAALELPTPPPPPVVAPPLFSTPHLSMIDLPVGNPSYDMTTLFDHSMMVQQQQPQQHPSSTWAMQPPSSSRQMDLRQHFGGNIGGGGGGNRPPPEAPSSTSGGGNGDLQELARELLQRRDRSVTIASTPLLITTSLPMRDNDPSYHSLIRR